MLPTLLFLIACGAEPAAPAAPAAPVVPAAPAAPPAAPPVAAPAPQRVRANLNTATEAELAAAVPGIGKKMLHEFEEYRPYVSIAQFRKEMAKYVDAATIAGYEQYVYVPVDLAASDASTLQQIGGLTEAEANAFIAGRPYADRAAAVAALGAALSPEEAAAAEALLAP